MNMGWQTPLAGFIKVNVDVTVSNGCSGFGVVVRDNDGFVLGGCYKFRNEAMDVSWAELKAFTAGLKLDEKIKYDSAYFGIGQCNASQQAIMKKCDLYFDMDYPEEIHNFIINDAIK
ncbi:hypothetical protein PVK06_017589 [Gossypium arboreum]|uniref:RNase H type-1 domain-containing protein n=1 Tax=Gossypium arboreum TaxID=29729 RepID=A0ABR0Q3K4_GOSAR|nr:hypothetical protein PVK06_017589 [Gossypium arboreum]